MSRLSIIGTAGRKEDMVALTSSHYWRMLSAVTKFIDYLNLDTPSLEVCSGGAAWSDHLAVSLVTQNIIKPEQLLIYAPANLEYYGYEGIEEDARSQRTANTANYYHKVFSSKVGIESIKELNTVVREGSRLEVIKNGFHARNAMVARFCGSDGYLLAFTFGDKDSPQNAWTIKGFKPYSTAKEAGLKDGGTAHTWDTSTCNKFHCKLGSIDESIYV